MDQARFIFDRLFDHNICDLVGQFPDYSINSDGQPFWSGPKRMPEKITFNSKDPLHILFMTSAANLIAFNLRIKQEKDQKYLKERIQATIGTKHIPKPVKIDVDDFLNDKSSKTVSKPHMNMTKLLSNVFLDYAHLVSFDDNDKEIKNKG
jgi:hypothetical protein